jgi:hypothetical protein
VAAVSGEAARMKMIQIEGDGAVLAAARDASGDKK